MPRYSDEFKAEALELLERNGGNVNGPAKQLGISGAPVRGTIALTYRTITTFIVLYIRSKISQHRRRDSRKMRVNSPGT